LKKKLVILGGGESGVGAAQLGMAKGWGVFLSDKGIIVPKFQDILRAEGIPFESGKHSMEDILNADLVVKSPGIPDYIKLIQDIKGKGIEIISEIEFAYRYTNATIVAITGSNGKTTTTLLTYHLLKNAGLNVALAGNIGESFAKQVINDDKDVFVLELSSFQLDGIKEFKADIAVLMNITPDHLDRYDNDFEKYIHSKFRITLNQSKYDAFIYCFDDKETMKYLKNHPMVAKQFGFSFESHDQNGAYINQEELNFSINNNKFTMSIHKLALQGKHNAYNSMASGITAKLLELRNDQIRDSLTDFETVEHRLESLGKVNGREFINDSKATNVNSTWYALDSVTNNVVWIVGGVDKGNDYNELLDLVKDKVKAIVCLGADNEKLLNFFSGKVENIVEASSADQAVSCAYSLSKSGDTVLLSPACASFDLFENYEDRGAQFKAAVRAL
jgi:UDP-N-acetylmuramoylalanine--D-glutamate ligase